MTHCELARRPPASVSCDPTMLQRDHEHGMHGNAWNDHNPWVMGHVGHVGHKLVHWRVRLDKYVSKFIVSIASYEKLLDFNRQITTEIK